MSDGWRLLPRAHSCSAPEGVWMRLWDAYLAVWVPLARAWARVWHRKRLREYDVMLDTWLPMMRADGSVTTNTGGPMRWVEGPPPPLPEIIHMPSRYRPARLIPPGATIARELEARGWDQRHLAEIMGCEENVVSGIIDAQQQITLETAGQLASAFGTSVEFWTNLEANYRQRISGPGRLGDRGPGTTSVPDPMRYPGPTMPRVEMVGRLVFVGKGASWSPLTLCGQSLEDILGEESGRFGRDLGLVRLTVEWLDGEEAPLG